MMGRALFDNAGFLAAARALACEHGAAAVTIDSVTERMKAPKGSFDHRFPSRDALLGELWLNTALAYQEGFVAAIEAGDGLAAALHAPAWSRLNLDDRAPASHLQPARFLVQAIGLHRSSAACASRRNASKRPLRASRSARSAARVLRELRRAAFVLVRRPPSSRTFSGASRRRR